MQRIIMAFILMAFASTCGAQIKVPAVLDLHDPIVAESTLQADVYIWHYDHEALKGIRVDGGRSLHLWGPEGKHSIRLTTISIDWETKAINYDEHMAQFTVGAAPPGPGPGPGPGPAPTAFKAKVKAALEQVDQAHKSSAATIATNYRQIADEAKANPGNWDAATMVNEAKARHTSTLSVAAMNGWKGFWPQLAKAMVELKLDSGDLEGHIKAFYEIAEVLKP